MQEVSADRPIRFSLFYFNVYFCFKNKHLATIIRTLLTALYNDKQILNFKIIL